MNGTITSDEPQSALRNNEAPFRAIFEAAAMGIAVVDSTGRGVKWNRAIERFLGYSETELRRMPFSEFTHPDDLQTDLDLYHEVLSGKRDYYQIEKRYITKDRRIVWARLTVSLIHGPSEDPKLVVALVEDITARKAAEQALRESEEKFFKAFHGNLYPTLITRKADARIIEANRAFAEWFGLSTEEAKTKTAFDFQIWEKPEDRGVLLKQLAHEGSIRNYRKAIRLPSGEERITLLSIQPLSLHGENCLLTISVDLTQQIQAEQALKRSEERLRQGLDAARMGIWEWHVPTNQIIWTQEVYSLFGVAPAQFDNTMEAVFKMVAPEDLDRVRREINEALEKPNRKYYSEMRILRPDGALRWIECRGEVQKDTAGRPVLMMGTVTDVTDRKRAEANLRASEESLRATIENTPDVAVQWFDENGRVIFWNRASETMFGWTAGEAHGKTLDQLIFDTNQTARFMEAIKQVARTGNPVPPTEHRFRRRDQVVGFCVLTVFRIPCDGTSFCYVCMDVDITGRKRAEESLQEMQERELRSREEFARGLLEAGEQERQRLAAELHDSLGQSLSIIKNKAYLASAQPGLSSAVTEHLNAIFQSASETITEVRQLVRNLRPIQIEQLGLTDSIRELVEKAARSDSMHLDYRVENIDDVIKGNSATHLYRIVQEALNNLFKHSGADRAKLNLERDILCVRLRLEDNGTGFNTEKASVGGGFGLKSIAERAQMLGGKLRLESILGTGTNLTVELPISDTHETPA
ncbi:MAG TPA: PAS domain S-box protein [Candidatus Angelobacter sp.]|nr:PAS domain S-box protein [Candidatus Angelobacter sp.]